MPAPSEERRREAARRRQDLVDALARDVRYWKAWLEDAPANNHFAQPTGVQATIDILDAARAALLSEPPAQTEGQDEHEFRMQLAELLRIAVGSGVPQERFAEFDRQRSKVIGLFTARLRGAAPEGQP